MPSEPAVDRAAAPAVASVEGLGDEVLLRADRLNDGDEVDGKRITDLHTLDDFLRHVWTGWQVVHRGEVGGSYSNGAAARWTIVLLRHRATGTWLITSLTMAYWTNRGVLHTEWEDLTQRSRLTTVAFHVFGLGKFTAAATLPALAENLAAEIAPRLGPNNRSSELDRHIRTARVLMHLEPDALARAVDETETDTVRHEAQTMRTMAALGGLGGIEAALAQAAVEYPEV